jgi:hypothetical protein
MVASAGQDTRGMQNQNFGTLAVTAEHGRTVGWQFIKEPDFSIEHPDSAALVINESAAKYIGIENPIGETVSWEWWREAGPLFNTRSLA